MRRFQEHTSYFSPFYGGCVFRCEAVDAERHCLTGSVTFFNGGGSRYYLALPFIYCLTTDCEIIIVSTPDCKDTVFIKATDSTSPLTLGDFMNDFSRFPRLYYV